MKNSMGHLYNMRQFELISTDFYALEKHIAALDPSLCTHVNKMCTLSMHTHV